MEDNYKAVKILRKYEKQLQELTVAASMDVAKACRDEETILQLKHQVDIINELEVVHGKAICVTALAMIEAADGEGVADIRGWAEACIEDFAGNLRGNLRRILAQHGHGDVFDPNAALRRELLEAIE